MTGDPLTTLREALHAFRNAAIFEKYPESIFDDALAALDAVEQLVQAAHDHFTANDDESLTEEQVQETHDALREALAPFEKK